MKQIHVEQCSVELKIICGCWPFQCNFDKLPSFQMIDLNVGGTRYTTSCSTLTKYPESMLGVMFSGRHDIEAMECSDGSFFIEMDLASGLY